jgi:hypothetical protein
MKKHESESSSEINPKPNMKLQPSTLVVATVTVVQGAEEKINVKLQTFTIVLLERRNESWLTKMGLLVSLCKSVIVMQDNTSTLALLVVMATPALGARSILSYTVVPPKCLI